MSTMRREYLRGYLFALFAEGEFAGLVGNPVLMLRRAAEMFAVDVPTVVGDLAEELARQAGEKTGHLGARLGAVVLGRMNEAVRDLGKRGVKAVWADLMDTYRRGQQENARHRKG